MNTNNKSKSPRHSLIPFVSIILLFLALILFNLPVIETLQRHSFDDGTYSHAFLIPFISLYLFFELTRSGKITFRENLSFLPVILVILSGIFLFITSNAQISLGYWLATLLLATASFIVMFNFSWIIIFPIAFLAFVFPFWGLLVPLLQNLSVIAVSFIMSFTGIPTFVDAQFITIPAGVFEIADGCSGLRYFIVSIAISSLFIFLYIKNIKRSILFFVVAILGALITNWIRITALIMIGEYTNMESDLMADHNAFGWYIYIPFMVLLFKWGNTLIDNDIFESTEIVSTNNKPNVAVTIIVLMVIMLSSTTIKSFIKNTNNIHLKNTEQLTKISPNVNYYSNVESNVLENNNTKYQIFNFNGSDLDGKPSYYDNNMLPEKHYLLESEIRDDWNIYFSQSLTKKSVILFKYELDSKTYTSLRTFKIARLKKALMNKNETKLHWVYLNCELDCKSVLTDFLKINN